MTPPPTTTTDRACAMGIHSSFPGGADPPGAGIERVQDQGRLGVDECASLDRRDQLAVHELHRSLEHAPRDALLAPDLAFLQLAVGEEAGELCARAGPAGGAIVGPARAEDEVPALRAGPRRQRGELDV